MPKTQTAKKELRKSARNRVRNLKRKDSVKDALKIFRKLVALKKADEARAAFPAVMKALDKTAKVGYMKRGTADRMKSRLAKSLAKIK
jgi:small subunit ribosomal protein S20